MAKLITEDELLRIREGLQATERVRDSINYSSMVQNQDTVIDNTNVVRDEAGLPPMTIPTNKFRENNKEVIVEDSIMDGMVEEEDYNLMEADKQRQHEAYIPDTPLESKDKPEIETPPPIDSNIFEKGGKIVDNVINKAKDNIQKFGEKLPSLPEAIMKNPLFRFNPYTAPSVLAFDSLEKLQKLHKDKKVFNELSSEQQKRITDAIIDVSEWAGIKFSDRLKSEVTSEKIGGAKGYEQVAGPRGTIEDMVMQGMQDTESIIPEKVEITPRELRGRDFRPDSYLQKLLDEQY